MNDYYFTIYDYYDNLVTGFDNIEALGKFFNIPIYKILYAIRHDMYLVLDSKKYKIYLMKKEKEYANTKTR